MHEAIVALHDRHGRGEPESGAAARLLRREEGIEDPIQDVGAYAGAGVRYSRDAVRARLASEVHGLIRAIGYDVLEVHGERAAVGHGIARIDAEIEKDLMHLRRIAGDGPEIRRRKELHRQRFRERIPEHSQQLLHEVHGIDRNALSLHAAGKAEHLLDQVCAMPGAGVKRLEEFPCALVVHEVLQYLYREHDGSEHVVEIVCDAAGEGTDALHALRTKNLLLELLALGEIEHEAHALVPAVLERRRDDEDANQRPSMPSVFLFIRTADAIGGELPPRTPICIRVLPGRHGMPMQAAARQI